MRDRVAAVAAGRTRSLRHPGNLFDALKSDGDSFLDSQDMLRSFLLAICLLALHPVAMAEESGYPPLPSEEDAPFANALPPAPIDAKLAGITDTDELLQAAGALAARGEHDNAARVWRRLADLRPHMGAYRYEMAAHLAQRNYKALVYNALIELQGQGFAFDLESDPRFEKARGTEVWKYIVEAFDVNRQPFGEGEVLMQVPGTDRLIESLAWDASRSALLLGSARSGSVYVASASGRLTPLVKADAANGMWGVFDIAVDAERKVLWVASTAVPHYSGYDAEKDLGGAGIFKFDLKSGKFIKRFLAPKAAGRQIFMSALALGPDGTVFAADGVNNAIYAIQDDRFRRVLHAPTLSSIRGMAVSADSKFLYFADYERGLFGIDLEQEASFEVAVPRKLVLAGIDGLVFWKGHLVAVQNGMIPKRVMKLKLAANGKEIESYQPLDANQEAFSVPTLATRDQDRLLLIANSQKSNYDRFGLVRDKSKLEPTRIYALDLNFGAQPEPPTLPGPYRP